MRRMTARLLLIVSMLSCGAWRGIAQDDPVARLSDDDLGHGERIYKAQCALCHGIDGAGGTGPSLQRPVLPRARDNKALYEVIRDGVEGAHAGKLAIRERDLAGGGIRSRTRSSESG